MIKKYDVIVLGLGGMGSAIAERLSRAGQRVLGLEQFSPVHDQGSSHGDTRVIRKAYFEDERYVPLMLRSYELWKDLEEFSNSKLLIKTGCAIIGPKTSPVILGSQKAAERFSLPHEMLDSSALKHRYGFHTPQESVGFYEPDGGYLLVEKCVEQFLNRAKQNGADLRFNCKTLSWRSEGGEVEVVTADEKFKAKTLVLAMGAWTGKNLSSESVPLQPKRAIQYWFESEVGSNLPVFFQDTCKGPWMYGFPKIGETLKVAFHNVLKDCDPDHMERNVSDAEIEFIAEHAKNLIPELGSFSRAKTCIYTMTPDEHFMLGRLKSPNQNVLIAAGFSGHGFKFVPVVGEIIHDIIRGDCEFDIGHFNPYRFE